jgi:hypothetical protein
MAVIVRVDSKSEWEGGTGGWVRTQNVNTDFETYPDWYWMIPYTISYVEYSKTYSSNAILSRLAWNAVKSMNGFQEFGYLFICVDGVWYPTEPVDPRYGWEYLVEGKEVDLVALPPGKQIKVRLYLGGWESS